MTAQAPTYDLMLLLDPQAEESVRAKVLADVSEAIAAQGELLRHDRWGERPLAYQIDHRASAEYHLLQFHVSRTELLDAADARPPHRRRRAALPHHPAQAGHARDPEGALHRGPQSAPAGHARGDPPSGLSRARFATPAPGARKSPGWG